MRSYCNELMKDMKIAVDNFPFESKSAYSNLMAQTYYFTSHSVRLLGLALSRTSVNQVDLFNYFTHQIEEENNHEKLALTDLKFLGGSLSEYPELPICRMMWETQYYKLEHIGAPTLLGYILVLESIAVYFAEDIAIKAEVLAKEKSVNRFMKVHGNEDGDHVDHGFKVLDKFGVGHEKSVEENMSQTAWAYQNMLNFIALSHSD